MYSSIKEIKVSINQDEVNDFLADWWILLKICESPNGPIFILGREFYKSFNEFFDDCAEGTE